MPSQFDNSYHHDFRKNTFDDAMAKKMWRIQKEADEVLEVRPPPIPTAEMEVEYIDWLQEDFKSDPWITYRFRKFTANPKRTPWKHQRKLKRQHQVNYLTNWMIGSFIAWPVAAMIGRRQKVTRGGVPVVQLNRWVHDFPRSEPGNTARRFFRFYSFGTAILLGLCFAQYNSNSHLRCSNTWYSRPDLKPFAAMVAKPEHEVTRDTMMTAQYPKNAEGEGKRSPIYRFFFGRNADFTIKENPYTNHHREDIWDSRVGHYPSYNNNFGSHHQ